jgi:hypothetical protein
MVILTGSGVISHSTSVGVIQRVAVTGPLSGDQLVVVGCGCDQLVVVTYSGDQLE